MDDRIDQMYRTEERFFNIFTFFALLAIFIAGLGILGLSAFMAEQRTKEIGVRKIFGASTGNLIYLLTKEFSLLVFLGFIIAAPLAYYFLDNWLQDFTYRTTIGWLPFVIAGVLALMMAWLTSGFQSLKAATANPIKSLRYE
jgi:putative ABC transport system permease protein